MPWPGLPPVSLPWPSREPPERADSAFPARLSESSLPACRLVPGTHGVAKNCRQQAHSQRAASLSAHIALPALPARNALRACLVSSGELRFASSLTVPAQEAHSESAGSRPTAGGVQSELAGKTSPCVPVRVWHASSNRRSCRISHSERARSAAATSLNFSSFSSCFSYRCSRSSFSSLSRVGYWHRRQVRRRAPNNSK